ncbi:MAG TPA: hypothetical protein VJ992_02565 [Gemmatimonadales bacterium]|nr:hypothetical protein [Gemmatimonadales bacterium]
MSRLLAVIPAVLLSAGCAVQQAPVPVQGSRSAIQRLAGTWTGGYESTQSGRSGSISFSLAANADTAFGDVIMMPRGTTTPLRPARVDGDAVPGETRMSTAVLTIRFVTVRDGRVEGTLDPYRDPGCGCLLLTTFVGTVRGDLITGTFLSHHVEGGANVRGTWEVRRKTD